MHSIVQTGRAWKIHEVLMVCSQLYDVSFFPFGVLYMPVRIRLNEPLSITVAVLQGSEQDGDSASAATSAERLTSVFPHVRFLSQSGRTIHKPS